MSAPRVVIVGAGLMGRWHADAARHAGATVVAVVDPVTERAQTIAGTASVHATLAEALQVESDLVHVCTPLASHQALTLEALAAGRHVILEKPASATRREAEALVAAARNAAKLLVPVHQFTFQDGIQRIAARREVIGPFRHIEFATCSAGADASPTIDRDLIAAEIIPHAFALARTLLNQSVGQLEWQLQRSMPGEWRATATTADGCLLSGLISLRARPTFATCRVLGEHGSATADLFQGFALFEPDTASTSYKMMRPVAVGLGTAGASAWQLAGRAMRWERAYPGLRALCTAAYAAMSGGPAPFRDDELVDVAAARDQLLARLTTS